jgi:hypothetical protein
MGQGSAGAAVWRLETGCAKSPQRGRYRHEAVRLGLREVNVRDRDTCAAERLSAGVRFGPGTEFAFIFPDTATVR